MSKVKNLQCPLICLEGNDLFVPVHKGTISLDWSSDDLIVIFEVDNDDFGIGIFSEFLTNTNEVIGFQGLYQS